jgi:hypothetical protein
MNVDRKFLRDERPQRQQLRQAINATREAIRAHPQARWQEPLIAMGEAMLQQLEAGRSSGKGRR